MGLLSRGEPSLRVHLTLWRSMLTSDSILLGSMYQKSAYLSKRKLLILLFHELFVTSPS